MAIRNIIEDMVVGDAIICRYKKGGFFSELGTCIMPELPLTGSANPDGSFYFRKVDTGMLIADRVVQTNISWDTLNSLKLIQGSPLYSNLTKNLPPSSFSVINKDRAYDVDTYDFDKAFDGTYATYYCSQHLPPPHAGVIDFIESKVIDCVTFTPYNGYLSKEFKVYGSNDNIIYSTLYNGILNNSPNIQLFAFSNNKSYRYYKIEILSVYTGGGAAVFYEIELGKSIGVVRSLSGGNSYLGENRKSCLTNKGLGIFPSNNEWDKYIVKSTLNNTIIAGDNTVWNWAGNSSICQDTTVTGTVRTPYHFVVGDYNTRVIRGEVAETSGGPDGFGMIYNSSVGDNWAFRPVLEYIEPKSKATTLFY